MIFLLSRTLVVEHLHHTFGAWIDERSIHSTSMRAHIDVNFFSSYSLIVWACVKERKSYMKRFRYLFIAFPSLSFSFLLARLLAVCMCVCKWRHCERVYTRHRLTCPLNTRLNIIINHTLNHAHAVMFTLPRHVTFCLWQFSVHFKQRWTVPLDKRVIKVYIVIDGVSVCMCVWVSRSNEHERESETRERTAWTRKCHEFRSAWPSHRERPSTSCVARQSSHDVKYKSCIEASNLYVYHSMNSCCYQSWSNSEQECPSGYVDEDSFKIIFSRFFPYGSE